MQWHILHSYYLATGTCKQAFLTCRARLAFAARAYLMTGLVPDPALANTHEPLVPWGPYGQVSMPTLDVSLYVNAL